MLPNARAQKKPASKYAGQPFVIQQKITDVSYKNNGTGEVTKDFRVRVQSSAGVQELGLLSFYYSADYQSLKIPKVSVRQPDGTVVRSGAGDIHDQPAPITNDAPLFSDLRMKQVTVRGLVPGALLTYRLVFRIRKPMVRGQFWYEYQFAQSAIILDDELKISLPKHRKVKVDSPGMQPEISTKGGRRIYFWKSQNLKIQKPVPGRRRPPYSVELSTFPSWAAVGQWWASLADPMAVPDAAVKAKAAELTRGDTTEQQKLHAIYDYVSTQFRYISVSFGIGHYRPHSADAVLQNGFGDCKDKDTLLVALLAAVHIPAYPALVDTAHKIDRKVPSPGQFDHVITVVPDNGKLIWLDTTAEVAPFGLLVPSIRNSLALSMPPHQPAKLERTLTEPPFQSLESFDVKGTFDSQGTLHAKLHVTLRGDAEIIYRTAFLKFSPQKQLQFLQSVSRLLGYGGKVSDVTSSSPDDLDKPFSYSYDYTRQNYPGWSDGEILPAIPFFLLPKAKKAAKSKPAAEKTGKNGKGAENGKAEANTGSGMALGPPETVDYRSQIRFPKGYQIKLPKPVALKDSFASYSATYSFKDGTLIVDRDLQSFTNKLPAADVAAYRKFRSALEADQKSHIRIIDVAKQKEARKWAEVHKLFSQGNAALRSGSPFRAESFFGRALKLDPQVKNAWLGIAQADMQEGQWNDAVTAARKEIAAYPHSVHGYAVIGYAQIEMHEFSEGLTTMSKMVQLAPRSANAHGEYGAALLLVGHDSRSAVQFALAVSLDPLNTLSRLALAQAYLRAKKPAKALAQYEVVAKMSPRPETWGFIASCLAEADEEFGPASHYAEKAVKAEEKATAGITLGTLTVSDFRMMSRLARYWGTLGFVDYLRSKRGPAEKYLRASWSLANQPLTGLRLGWFYKETGRKQRAIRTYAMARAVQKMSRNSPPVPVPPGAGLGYPPPVTNPGWVRRQLEVRLRELLGSENRVSEAVAAAESRLSQLRTAKLPLLVNKANSADFYILLEPGKGVVAIRYISGSASLRSATKTLVRTKFQALFPDDGPTRIVRRVLVSCSSTIHACNAVLYPPDAIHSVN